MRGFAPGRGVQRVIDADSGGAPGVSHRDAPAPLRNVNVPYAYPTPAPTPTPFQFLDSGRSRPVANTCPGAYPIKGNMSSMIYHAPGDEYYARTTPEICFANEEYAQRAGYRRARR